VIPESSNFFATLYTKRSRQRLSELFKPLNWSVRPCGSTSYELRSPFAELVVEAESPILLHGSVDDIEANIDRIIGPLRIAGVAFIAECYGVDGELLREWHWGSVESS
jgi:hypothetical protein